MLTATFDNQTGRGWKWFLYSHNKWKKGTRYYRTYDSAMEAGHKYIAKKNTFSGSRPATSAG